MLIYDDRRLAKHLINKTMHIDNLNVVEKEKINQLEPLLSRT